MIENCLAILINAAQAREIALFARGNYAVQHDPVAAFAKVVFELHHKRQIRLTAENVSTSSQFSKQLAYFPMQKLLKIRLRMSSVVVAPVISSNARSPL